jgi:hypothetical protein
MRLMTIFSLLQEWVDGTVAYHSAIHSDLRSLEAIAAACDSMSTLLLIQAVISLSGAIVFLNLPFDRCRISGRDQGQGCSSGRCKQPCQHHAELSKCHISGVFTFRAALGLQK